MQKLRSSIVLMMMLIAIILAMGVFLAINAIQNRSAGDGPAELCASSCPACSGIRVQLGPDFAKQKHASGFGEVAELFGIAELLNRWVVIPETGLELLQFTGYLTLIQYVGIAYIANFSLQRINEAASLRADCLLWENDPLLGRVPILRGETTKTERDSDARWPTSPSVAIAVDAMNSIARLRIVCAAAHPKIGPQEA